MSIRNPMLFLAGLAAFATAVAHIIAGQTHIANVMASDIASMDRAVMLAVWHMVSAILLASGVTLIAISLRPGVQQLKRAIGLAVGILFGLFGAIFIAVSIMEGVAALQFIAMLVIALLAFIGSRRPGG